MGRHETFDTATPIADDLLTGTMLARAYGTDLPAVGSREAMTAFHAACSAFDRLTTLSEADYETLRIGDTLVLWTTDWVKAAQRGDFSRFSAREAPLVRSKTPAELSDLLVLTARRDLQFAEAERQTNLKTLHALAYPNGEDRDPDPASDAAHIIIAKHRAAYAQWLPHLDAITEAIGGSPEFAAAEAAGHDARLAEEEAFANLIDAQATTLPGLVALAGYLPEAVRLNGCSDPDDDGVRALRSMCNDVLALAASGQMVSPGDVDPTDWDAPPPGFMAYPEREPMSFLIIREGLRLELERLHRIALAEHNRRVGPDVDAEHAEHVRRQLRLDVFEAASQSIDTEKNLPEAVITANLKAMSVSELASAHDAIVLLKDVAHAASCQPRCASGKSYPEAATNAAGDLILSIAEALTAVEDDALKEMRTRTPIDEFDRTRRLQVLAHATAGNGDPDETRAFARELLATVET